MNRNASIFAAFALLVATTASAESITFGSTDISAGDSWTETSSYSSNVSMSGVSHEKNVTCNKSSRVLAAGNNNRIESLEVTYADATFGAVAGKRYAVSASGNSVDVSYANGGTPSAEEVAFVRSDNAHLNQFRALDRIFGGNTFTVGTSTSPHAKDAEELVNLADGVELRGMALTLRSVSGTGADRVAKFDISMTLGSGVTEKKKGKAPAAGNGGMTMTLNGTLDVAVANGRLLLLDVNGPISMTTRKPNNQAIADGSGSMSMRVSYSGF